MSFGNLFGNPSGWMTDSTDSVVVSAGQQLSFQANCGSEGVNGFVGAFYCASAQFVSSDTSNPPIQSAQMLATVGSSDIYPEFPTQKYAAFLGILGTQNDDADVNEAEQQVECHNPGRWRNIACNVDSNIFILNTIVTNRINAGKGSMSINIPANTSGYFEDETDFDDVNEGDLLDYGFLAGTKGALHGSTHLTMDWIGAHFIASTSDQCMIGGTPTVGLLARQPGYTYYSPLFGGGNAASNSGDIPSAIARATGMFPYAALVSEFSNHIVSWSGPQQNPGMVTFNLLDKNGDAVLTTSASANTTGWVTASGSHQFEAWDTCLNEFVVAGIKNQGVGKCRNSTGAAPFCL